MDYMFGLCKNLKKLDLSSFEIKNIKSIIGLFYKCPSLVNLTGLSQWNTNQVIDMSYLFCDCSSLNSLPDIFNGIQIRLTTLVIYFVVVLL